MCYSLKNILKATNAVLISWVISGSPVTTESIVGIDTWFGRFGVFRKKYELPWSSRKGGGIWEKPNSKTN